MILIDRRRGNYSADAMMALHTFFNHVLRHRVKSRPSRFFSYTILTLLQLSNNVEALRDRSTICPIYLQLRGGSFLKKGTKRQQVVGAPKSYCFPETISGGAAGDETATLGIPMSENRLLGWSATVGALSAVMSIAYRHVLEALVELSWKTIPEKLGSFSSPWYTIIMMTVSGALVSFLSCTWLSDGMSTSAWITCSGDASLTVYGPIADQNRTFPERSLMKQLRSTLILTLLVSASGFSLGPEAPMVCAGGLLGAALASLPVFVPPALKECSRPLSIAGAAGALSAFVGMPLVGAIFVLELLGTGVGIEHHTCNNALHMRWRRKLVHSQRAAWKGGLLSPAVAASIASALVCAVGHPHAELSGHFRFSSLVGTVGAGIDDPSHWGASLLLATVPLATLGTLMTGLLAVIVRTIKASSNQNQGRLMTQRQQKRGEIDGSIDSNGLGDPCHEASMFSRVTIGAIAGLFVGLIGVAYPQTVLWGETRLAHIVFDRQMQPHQDIHPSLERWAWVDPQVALNPTGAAQVGIAKFSAIALALSAGFPGGVIFPLFFAAAAMAQGFCAAAARGIATFLPTSSELISARHKELLPPATVILMASMQSAATRTPLSTSLLLALSMDGTFPGEPVPQLFSFALVAAYLSTWGAQAVGESIFSAHTANPRRFPRKKFIAHESKPALSAPESEVHDENPTFERTVPARPKAASIVTLILAASSTAFEALRRSTYHYHSNKELDF